jgi:long-chain acyl-CoA synthetase
MTEMTEKPQFPWDKSYPRKINWAAPLPIRPAYEILEKSVRLYPDRPCLDFLDRVYSYAEVGDLVNRAARGLQQQGVKKGTRVGLFLPNTPYYVILYFAILKAGGVVVNFNPLYAPREIEKQIANCGCELMATLDLEQLYAKLHPLLGKTSLRQIIICPMADILPFAKKIIFPFIKFRELAHIPHDEFHVPFAELTKNDGKVIPTAIDPENDVAVLQYTGGTTGLPKGAMLTHANITANTAQSVMWYPGITYGEEKMLGVLPFFHVFAMTAVMNFTLYSGGEIIMLPRFDLKQTIQTIHKKRPTLFQGVPTIYTAINHFKDIASYDLSSIRFCISGGAGLPVEVKTGFEKLTGCALVEGYGLSETSPVATCNPVDGVNKTGTIGLPIPGTIIEIISLEDRTTPVPQGERGEVCITGPQVMKGYWNNDAETAANLIKTPNGMRFHTGDIGVMDADGYTSIVDRIKDVILCGGYNVYPRIVEEAIYQHPAIAECAVAGLPDEYRGQTVKAYVALKAGQSLTKDALLEFLKDRISPIEMPKFVEFRETLPKTLIGKISRKALLDEEAVKAAETGAAEARAAEAADNKEKTV